MPPSDSDNDKLIPPFIKAICSTLPPPPNLSREVRDTYKPNRTKQQQQAITIEARDRKQTYLLIQSMERNNPAAALRLKREIALQLMKESAVDGIYLTLSSAHDIVEAEYQRTIGKDSLTVNLAYARERFKAANAILHPVMSKGFRIGNEPEE